jgi:hypothetical protein
MGLFSFETPGGYARQALLVCDVCDHFFAEGARSRRAKRDALPDEWTPYFEPRDELPRVARDAGWLNEVGEREDRARWFCPECKGGPRK